MQGIAQSTIDASELIINNPMAPMLGFTCTCLAYNQNYVNNLESQRISKILNNSIFLFVEWPLFSCVPNLQKWF